MTEHLQHDRLRQIAEQTEQPAPPPRAVPRMSWTIDATSGRPVARWVVVAEPDAARPGGG